MSTLRTIILSIILCSVSYGAAISSNGTGGGDWSAGATWNGGVAPVNGDSAIIVAGDTVTCDVDLITAAIDLVGLQIVATATLNVDTAAGTYSIKCSANIDNDGTFQAGTSTSVPLPSDVTFTIDFDNTASSIQTDDTTGSLLFYCTEPTNKYIQLSAAELSGQTTISVDTDVTSDWSAGDFIVFCDFITSGAPDIEEHEIDAIRADEIDLVGGGLANDKYDESFIFLRSRNIKIINSTTYAVRYGHDSYCGAEIYDCAYGYGDFDESTIAGAVLVNTNYLMVSCENTTFNGCYADLGATTNTICVYASYGCTTGSDSLICDGRGSYQAYALTYNGISVGCSVVHLLSSAIVQNGDIYGCPIGFQQTSAITLTGQTQGISSATFYLCYGITISDTSTGGTIGGITSARDLYYCGSGRAFSTTFGATTEFDGYDSALYRMGNDYFESSDHDNTVNAFKAWCLGGTVVSDTSAPLPTGYTTKYIFTAKDTSQTYHVFRQFETTVQPGNAIEVEGYIAIPNGENLTGVAPAMQLIDPFNDVLVNSSASVLDEDTPDDVTGATTTFQAVDVIWANTGDSPRQVIVRMIAYHDGGGDDVAIYGVWTIADYKDQINTLYTVLMPVKTDVATSNTTTSFTLTGGTATADIYNNWTVMVQDADDDHWELRSVEDWTAGKVITVSSAFGFTPAVGDLVYIMATSYGAPVDTASIADAVWDEATADHTTETTFGGELGTLDPNITAILADTSAYDTDAEYAAAIWNALMSSYGTAGTYGEELEELDPNVTLILADTNELQTDWANGGRLDLLIDAIKYKTDLITILDTTVADANDTNNFTLSAGTDVNDALWFNLIIVEDADDSHYEIRLIDRYDENSSEPNVWVDESFSFTPASGDVVHVMGTGYAGYLYDILNAARQSSAVINVIDATGSSTRRGTETIWKEDEDNELVPGI